MVDGATEEDVLASRNEEPIRQKEYLSELSGGLSQLGTNPLAKIDFTRAEAMNAAKYAEKKTPATKRIYTLKKLFLQYAKKYALKWNAVMNYPKQIKQKPAWFDLALSLFKENEISSADKKIINTAFNQLWEFRDRIEPERVMSEEESLRQYGVTSPYFQQPEQEVGGIPSEGDFESTEVLPQQETYIPSAEPEPVFKPTEENTLGVRKVVPQESGDYLSGYMTGFKSNIVDMTPFSPKPIAPRPQGEVNLGLTPAAKKTGGSGSGAFNIGRDMFSSFRGGESLKSIMTPTKPSLPSQPVSVVPAETITVASTPTPVTAPVTQRKKKLSISGVDRTTKKISIGLAKFRNIELPDISKSKVSGVKYKAKRNVKSASKSKGFGKINGFGKIKGLSINSSFENIKTGNIKSSATFNKNTIGNMSMDIRNNVGGIVGGIKNLKKQVRGEFREKEALKPLNLKNIRSNKVTSNKDLNVLNKLKSETRSHMSREALECKMVPKLQEHCGKVFSNNRITGEVSKFRNEFKDIAKAVPVVKGEKARLTEVGIIGGSIDHGIANAQVEDVKRMYKNSGSTKQLKIGMVEYDYSFATGKKRKIKTPPVVYDEYYEEEQ